jgi:hypothetical protein
LAAAFGWRWAFWALAPPALALAVDGRRAGLPGGGACFVAPLLTASIAIAVVSALLGAAAMSAPGARIRCALGVPGHAGPACL